MMHFPANHRSNEIQQQLPKHMEGIRHESQQVHNCGDGRLRHLGRVRTYR